MSLVEKRVFRASEIHKARTQMLKVPQTLRKTKSPSTKIILPKIKKIKKIGDRSRNNTAILERQDYQTVRENENYNNEGFS